jgi:hypothetical protein
MKSSSVLTSVIAVATLGLSAAALASPPDAQAGEKLGDHPAVTIAKKWNTRGIDPNTFIVAHPAGLKLTTASSSENAAQLARAKDVVSQSSATSASPTAATAE